MAFDPLQYLKNNQQEEVAFDPSAYISKNAPSDVPTDEMFGAIEAPVKTRELTTGQKISNVLGDVASMGGQKVYSEYATPEEIAYDEESKLGAGYQAGKSIIGDVLALGSAGTGEIAEKIGLADEKPFAQRFAESSYHPDISEKAQTYKEKFMENLQAAGPLNEFGALNRLRPGIQEAPSTLRALPGVNKTVETSAKLAVKGQEAANKAIDLTKSAMANAYNKINIKGNEKIAKFFMNQALSPTITQHTSGAGENAVNYMLRNNLNATKGGVKYIEDDITKLNSQVDDIINATKGKTIRKNHIFKNLDDARNKFVQQVDNEADLKAFDAVINRFKDRFNNKTISVKEAHDLKKGTYARLNKKYGELGSAEVEAQKTVARLLKEEVERMTTKNNVNRIKDLNGKIREAVDTLDVVTRRTFLDSNKKTFHGLSLLAHDPTLGAVQHFSNTGFVLSNIAKPFNWVATKAPLTGLIKNTAKAPYLVGKELDKALSPIEKLRYTGLLSAGQNQQ